MQSFDHEIQSFIIPGNGKELVKINLIIVKNRTPEQNWCRTVSDLTCTWRYCMSKTAINAGVSTSESFNVQYLNNQTSDHPGSYMFLTVHTLSGYSICFQNCITTNMTKSESLKQYPKAFSE